MPLIIRFDAWQFVDLYLAQPALFIAGEAGDGRWHTSSIYDIVKDINVNTTKIVVLGG
jgi:hypothetical protein